MVGSDYEAPSVPPEASTELNSPGVPNQLSEYLFGEGHSPRP